jgi:hypothetical protein
MINFSAAFKSAVNKYTATTSIVDYVNAAGIGVVGGRLFVDAGSGAEAIATAGASSAEVVTATNVITAVESGKTFFLNSATEFVSTLPAPAIGLRFKFIVKAAPSGADYTIVTNATANIIKGHVLSADLNAASDGDIETSGGDTISFVSAKAVAGDWVEVECDGTNWFASGRCSVFDAITITTAS